MKQRPTARLRALVKRGKFLELPAAFDYAIEQATVEKAYRKKKRGVPQ
jgi:hypothetical protein